MVTNHPYLMCVSVGIHGVMVRIRDDDLKTMPGVRVEDMGYVAISENIFSKFM